MPELKNISAGGWNTRYLETGDPSSPTVILLHDGAYGATGELSWGSVAARLHERYHVLAPDMLGWGGSDKVLFFDRSPYVPRIQQIAAFCAALEVRDAVFIGVSFGGSVLLRALVQADQPFPVSLGIALNATGGPFRRPERLAELGDYAQPSLEAARKITALLVEDVDTVEDHVAARYEASMIPGHWEVMAASTTRNPAAAAPGAPADFLPQLGAVTVPVVYIEGTRDKLLEPGWARTMSAATPGSRAVTAPFAHEPNIDAPDALASLLTEIIEEELP